jgi:hypothetical protein
MKAWNFDLLVASAAMVAVVFHWLALTGDVDGATVFKAIALAAAGASLALAFAEWTWRSATRRRRAR